MIAYLYQLTIILAIDSKEEKAFRDFIYGTELMDIIPRPEFKIGESWLRGSGTKKDQRIYSIETSDTRTMFSLGYYWHQYQTDRKMKLKSIFKK